MSEYSIRFFVNEPSHVGEIRRLAQSISRDLNFSETETGKLAIAITESGKNLLKHAKHGEILIRRLSENSHLGLEFLAIDSGPGMKDSVQCLQDGFSTAGTSGTGLGAIRRLAQVFDLYSQPSLGTIVLAQFWSLSAGGRPISPIIEYGVVCLPHPSETVCGDSWSIHYNQSHCFVFVVDGLGHGPAAAEAAQKAIRIFDNQWAISGIDLMNSVHQSLLNTRGAAGALTAIEFLNGIVTYTGIGNIASAVLTLEKQKSMASIYGTLGHQILKVQSFQYPWTKSTLLVMHSDGLKSKSVDFVSKYPGLIFKHPALIAGVLYRDFRRDKDDVTVLVAREGRSRENNELSL